MRTHDRIAASLGMTRPELTVVSLLLVFFLLGLVLRNAGLVRPASDFGNTTQNESFSDAYVDSLLDEAMKLEAAVVKNGPAAGNREPSKEKSTRRVQQSKHRATDPGIVFATASKAELASIPGISNVLAGRLIEFRKSRQGKVERFRDFLDVKGIGRKRLETLQQHLVLE
ncbi:hypothetical protein CHL67_10340 [Prosthecochloris sp. GSB1]|uniref:ComEA family DNA-binding protein n=1 Tax=Prosthecochloris sp. GSB1 TaxID=281093 RepID=UPI000B8C7DAF|nr:helix-hairpin-helix domain-containing protein [Prosthecochloris sp. GSB1]ASQ91256.1 hypothetical protein CHL67_10340 [Prosthecochloris sp. GSB1]